MPTPPHPPAHPLGVVARRKDWAPGVRCTAILLEIHPNPSSLIRGIFDEGLLRTAVAQMFVVVGKKTAVSGPKRPGCGRAPPDLAPAPWAPGCPGLCVCGPFPLSIANAAVAVLPGACSWRS